MAITSRKEPRKLELAFEERATGKHLCKVKMRGRRISIPEGEYRLVYGVPRKLWPVPSPKGGIILVENYEYELNTVMKEGFLKKVMADYKKLDWGRREALEIKGQFDPENGSWEQGAEALFRIPETGGTSLVGLPQWRFALYEGDKLFDAAGALVAECRL